MRSPPAVALVALALLALPGCILGTSFVHLTSPTASRAGAGAAGPRLALLPIADGRTDHSGARVGLKRSSPESVVGRVELAGGERLTERLAADVAVLLGNEGARAELVDSVPAARAKEAAALVRGELGAFSVENDSNVQIRGRARLRLRLVPVGGEGLLWEKEISVEDARQVTVLTDSEFAQAAIALYAKLLGQVQQEGAALLAAAPQEAPAPPAERPPEGTPAARAAWHHARAKRHYDLGRFGDAVSEWSAAYELDGRPEFLYNMGNAIRRRGELAGSVEDLRQARHFFRRYRDSAEAPAGDVDRILEELEAELRKLEGRSGAE